MRIGKRVVLPLVPLLAFATAGAALFQGGGLPGPGIVKKSWCVNFVCYANDAYDCYDNNNDGNCDESRER